MKDIVLGKGYKLDDSGKRLTEISLKADERTRHLWCFGTTGVGKTKLIESILEQDIPAGKSVIFIDPKGDGSVFGKIVQLAKESNRMDDLMLFTPIFPEHSIHFNPLKHFYMLEEQVAHIISGTVAGKDPFFQNVAYEISLALVMVDHFRRYGNFDTSKAKMNPYSLSDVLAEVSHSEIGKIIKEISKHKEHEAVYLVSLLEKIQDSGADYYNKVSSNLRVALMEQCNGNVGEVIGKTFENPVMDRLESGKSVIFVVQLGALLTRKSAYTVAKVILSSIQAFVGRTQVSGRKITPPLTVHIDEAQSAIYQGIDELFAKGGSTGIMLHGYCQSISQLYSTVQKDYAHAILDNCNTKLFMRVTDAQTAEYISKHFGIKKTMSPIITGSGSMSFRDDSIERVRPEDVVLLSPRMFYLLTYKGMFYGKTHDVRKSMLEIQFPDTDSRLTNG